MYLFIKKKKTRLHSKKYHAINYESIPLHGALDVVTASMASIICVSVLKKKCQQSDLYQDMSPCVRCQDFDILPDEVVRKVSEKIFSRNSSRNSSPSSPCLLSQMNMILLCLQNPNDIENIICRIKEVLYILEKLTPCRVSEKIQTLSLLLKETVKKLVNSSQTLEGNHAEKRVMIFTKNLIFFLYLFDINQLSKRKKSFLRTE